MAIENLEESLKQVAEFDGYVEVNDHPDYARWFTISKIKHLSGYSIHELEYHNNWKWQIPVWSKLWKEARGIYSWFYVDQIKKFENSYISAINFDSPEEGFKILVSFLSWYKEKKERTYQQTLC